MAKHKALTVAVTGPTGEIGRSVIAALERSPRVARILGMARGSFDPATRGWKKVIYRRGDVLDPVAVASLVADADVVVHLAFIIMGSARETHAVNLRGSRNVFAATASARIKRLVYASSVAAYGFHKDNRLPLREDTPARGSASHYYSAQKAEVETVLSEELASSETAAYVFRPCIVAGPDAPMLINRLPYTQIAARLPRVLTRTLGTLPLIRPVLPDPGVRLQLVHHDDVARAMLAAVLGKGSAGPYNLAGPGELTIGQIASELHWHSIPLPGLAVDALAQAAAALPFLPAQLQWVAALSEPVIMDTAKARRELGWRPASDALQTLRATIAAVGR